ncbi:GRB10-interacting GYF protein 2-like [Ipomoea triloba]|uniref:GRB10-interacting GYF protein 2-like n=1 Tax=Ipomoea triloba TaxID=35885 RepID=UPI00125DF142|nr:GRB10-interacting GYF protein 2-like [Ipomoea triloba]
MSPASRSKSKDKRAAKEAPKTSPKSSSLANAGGGIPTSGYNPLLGTFHSLDSAPVSFNAPTLVNGRFRGIDETDDHIGNLFGNVAEYDSVSNNGSWSGESEDHKEKTSLLIPKQDAVPGADNDKREKIRQKNERKHQRQKERRAQELHEKCSGFLMSRKVEVVAQQLVAMGFSQEQATMALILNEGRVEQSVAWLLEGNEEADKQKEHQISGGGNLKIDIAEELARIADLELRYKCSRQEVERAIVACEGDLEKAEETLRAQKQEPPLVPPKPEENGDPPTMSGTKLPIAGSQNSIRAPAKAVSSTTLQQKRDEKDFNYTKVTATATSSLDPQSLKRVQPKLEWAKPPQLIVPNDKRWTGAGSNPSSSYSLASPLQASTPTAKTEARYVTVGNELKSLQLGSVREPVIVMQRPQSINQKQTPSSSISSSPPGNAAGWYPNSFEPTKTKPNGLMQHVPGTRSLSSNAVSTNQLYNQLHYQQQQQQQQPLVSSNGSLESSGTNRSNSLWNRTGSSQPQTLAAASLGLFSGLGTNPPSGSSSPVDWKNGCSMPQFDYTNIDWSLDCGSSSSRSGGQWPSVTSYMQNNSRTYDSFVSGLGAKKAAAMRPVLSNGVSIPRLQDGVGVAETSGGGLLEWTSPFEEKDLFSLSRQFVYSPSL